MSSNVVVFWVATVHQCLAFPSVKMTFRADLHCTDSTVTHSRTNGSEITGCHGIESINGLRTDSTVTQSRTNGSEITGYHGIESINGLRSSPKHCTDDMTSQSRSISNDFTSVDVW